MTTRPYGTWSSPITAEMLASAGVALAETLLDDGVVYWVELRPAEGGRQVLVRGDAFTSPADVTPSGFNVRTRVHEYGGGAYCVHRGTVYFSNDDDQRVYRQEIAADPVAVTPDTEVRHRYADGRVTADGTGPVTRVLVVDDEPQILRGLGTNLRARGYEVDTAPDGEQALELAAHRPPDAVLLDLGLPDLDGSEVIAGLRGWTNVPIIVLSARTGQGDKVEALDAGADDYVTKPFGMDELLARLRAAVRRSTPAYEAAVVTTQAFTVDLGAKRVTTAEGDIRLTPTEWQLVELLVRHPGKLLSQRQLLQEVWGPRYEEETNYLRVYMAQIRRKLEPDPARPRFFITEPGMGYRFEPEAEPEAEPEDEPGTGPDAEEDA